MVLDLLVLAVLLISAVIAFLRGFIREVLTILGVLGGLVAAYFGGPHLSPVARGWFGGDVPEGDEPEKLLGMIPYDIVADAIAYGSIFIIVVIVLSIASHLLSGWAKAIGLGAIDRTLGVIFGLVRGVVIIALLYLPIHVLVNKETREGWFENSRTHFYVDATSNWMLGLLPQSMKDSLTGKVEEGADKANSTREMLQELDVLTDGMKKQKQGDAAGGDNDNPDGYQEDQLKDMNELFEENYND